MLDYGFNGYQLPVVPRACRSPRGRGTIRKKFVKNQRHEFKILARVAEKFSGECESRASVDPLSRETEEEEEETEGKAGGFVVSNFLETMELDVEPVSVIGSDRNLPTSLSKDWLALGPCRAHCSSAQVDYIHNEQKSTESDGLDQKDGNIYVPGKWKRVSGSEIDCRADESRSVKADELDCKARNFSMPRNRKRVSDSKIDYRTDDAKSTETDEPDQKAGDCTGLGNRKRVPDYRVADPTGVDRSHQKNAGNSSVAGNWKRLSDSKIGKNGKRKLRYPKERNSSETNSQDSQSIYPFKKRKFFHQNHLSESRAAPADQQSAPEARDHNVKFSIKSFKVPELFIDVPVSATVGSLKTMVMEAVMKILKDGLNVGVLLQGKKVGDDSKTLIQTGIPRDDKNGHLGFTLEPEKPETTSAKPQTLTGVVGHAENNAESLPLVPCRRKPIRQPETVRRRIRRPFTVSEVEALVQAVEKLGTGRWRDVKSRAFDNANHRTYVDLKDKWKTLVHTARISPRQRRGEPVPQELLDRVLAAHAFWSDRQAHLKLKASP